MTATSLSKPKRSDTRSGRYYTIDGVDYPSVTTILAAIAKPALVNWAAKVERELAISCAADLYEDLQSTPPMPRAGYILSLETRMGRTKKSQNELQRAGEIGSQVHALIEWELRRELGQAPGPCPKISDAAQWAFMSWQDWRRKVNLRPLYVEQAVYSKTHGFAGTMDLLAMIEGKPTVLDWKTSKAIYAEAHLQNCAYRVALREMCHGDSTRGLIVRLPKTESDPNFEPVEALDEKPCFDVFLATKKLWEWTRKMDTWEGRP